MDLFETSSGSEPLASRMRPKTIDEYIGQEHILGKGRLLRRLIQADRLSSIILYGPPGTGKTTLAQVIANTTESRFITMNAVLSGIKDLRLEIEEAKKQQNYYKRRTTLFVDEVHRWNKAQQDALLPWVENGTVILIGATTENPYFEVNSALVSRSRLFQLTVLSEENLKTIANNAISSQDRGYGRYQINFEENALEHIVSIANGDARTLLNALELAVETSCPAFPPTEGTIINVTLESAEESIQKKVLLYDKEGDYHFDTISAFIKSIRGSDPDAALYWMARMIRGGEDPRYIFRRMLISASEDIGMADPNALIFVQSAAAAYDRVGMPEGQFHLAHSALYLATAPKSNSSLAFFDALSSLSDESSEDVPVHLRDSNRDAKGFGHGEGYLYPHAYRDHWVAQQYLPLGMKGRTFYQPSTVGYEGRIRSEIDRKRELQLEAYAPRPVEILTFAKSDTQLEVWIDRTTSEESRHILKLYNSIFKSASPIPRHGRMLIPTPGYGYPVWEAMRQVPEGEITAVTEDKKAFEIIQHKGEELDPLIKPVLHNMSFSEFFYDHDSEYLFETIISNGLLASSKQKSEIIQSFIKLLAPKGSIIICEPIVSEGTNISSLIKEISIETNFTEQIEQISLAENAAYADSSPGEWDFNRYLEEIKSIADENKNECLIDSERLTISFNRQISLDDLNKWLKHYKRYNSNIDIVTITKLLKDKHVQWTRVYGIFKLSFA